MSRLPERPRGVRRHWKKTVPDPAAAAETLRDYLPTALGTMGDPIEAAEFRHAGRLRHLSVLFSSGMLITLSLHKSGGWVLRRRYA